METLFKEGERCRILVFPKIQLMMTGVSTVYRGIGNKEDCYALVYEDGEIEQARCCEFVDPANIFSIVGCVQEVCRKKPKRIANMTKTKESKAGSVGHTKGPWSIGLDSDNERTQVIASDGGHICYVEYSPTKANASLISSAPELLEALRKVAAGFPYAPELTAADMHTIKKIIAKAEGRNK